MDISAARVNYCLSLWDLVLIFQWMWPRFCNEKPQTENLSMCCFSSLLITSLFSLLISSSSPPSFLPVLRAVIDMPTAINQPGFTVGTLSERTGSASLEGGWECKLASSASLTAYLFLSLWIFNNMQPSCLSLKSDGGGRRNPFPPLLSIYFPVSNSYWNSFLSCQLIGCANIKSNHLTPLQPSVSNAFSLIDKGFGSPNSLIPHSWGRRRAHAQMIDMFSPDGAKYDSHPSSSALPNISLKLWRKVKLKRVFEDKCGERK